MTPDITERDDEQKEIKECPQPLQEPPRQCNFPDIDSSGQHRELWNANHTFYFSHIAKTMGTNIFNQLPEEYQWKFKWHGGPNEGNGAVTFYERLHGVKLRQSSSEGQLHAHTAHTRLDKLVEFGILRCSDIDHMDVISIVRDPWKRFISLCNFHGETVDTAFKQIGAGNHEIQDWTMNTGMVDFEFDWNATVFTQENKEGITAWFADHGVEVLFDDDHHENETEQKQCKMEDLTEEQKRMLETEVLVDEIALYEAVRDNGGMMQIKYGYQWVRD